MDRRFPIGPFRPPVGFTPASRAAAMERMAALPKALHEMVGSASEQQLDTPYRDGGWTLRQVVHHVPDSHMNAFLRLKLALTEERPVIKPYDETAWALLEDARSTPVDISLGLVYGLHDRMLRVLRAMSPEEFARVYIHPVNGETSLDAMLALYAWHGDHHLGHCRLVMEG